MEGQIFIDLELSVMHPLGQADGVALALVRSSLRRTSRSSDFDLNQSFRGPSHVPRSDRPANFCDQFVVGL